MRATCTPTSPCSCPPPDRPARPSSCASRTTTSGPTPEHRRLPRPDDGGPSDHVPAAALLLRTLGADEPPRRGRHRGAHRRVRRRRPVLDPGAVGGGHQLRRRPLHLRAPRVQGLHRCRAADAALPHPGRGADGPGSCPAVRSARARAGLRPVRDVRPDRGHRADGLPAAAPRPRPSRGHRHSRARRRLPAGAGPGGARGCGRARLHRTQRDDGLRAHRGRPGSRGRDDGPAHRRPGTSGRRRALGDLWPPRPPCQGPRAAARPRAPRGPAAGGDGPGRRGRRGARLRHCRADDRARTPRAVCPVRPAPAPRAGAPDRGAADEQPGQDRLRAARRPRCCEQHHDPRRRARADRRRPPAPRRCATSSRWSSVVPTRPSTRPLPTSAATRCRSSRSRPSSRTRLGHLPAGWPRLTPRQLAATARPGPSHLPGHRTCCGPAGARHRRDRDVPYRPVHRHGRCPCPPGRGRLQPRPVLAAHRRADRAGPAARDLHGQASPSRQRCGSASPGR